MHAQAQVVQQTSNHTPIVTFSNGSTIYLGACQQHGQPTQFPDVSLVVTCFGSTSNPNNPSQITDNSSRALTFNIPSKAKWVSCNFSHVPHRHHDLCDALDQILLHVNQGQNISIHCVAGTHRAPVICALAISSLTTIPLHTAFHIIACRRRISPAHFFDNQLQTFQQRSTDGKINPPHHDLRHL